MKYVEYTESPEYQALTMALAEKIAAAMNEAYAAALKLSDEEAFLFQCKIPMVALGAASHAVAQMKGNRERFLEGCAFVWDEVEERTRGNGKGFVQ